MPFVLDDSDFLEMMTQVKVSNALSETIIAHLEFLRTGFVLILILEVVLLFIMFVEWRFPEFFKTFCMPPESDKKISLLSSTV